MMSSRRGSKAVRTPYCDTAGHCESNRVNSRPGNGSGKVERGALADRKMDPDCWAKPGKPREQEGLPKRPGRSSIPDAQCRRQPDRDQRPAEAGTIVRYKGNQSRIECIELFHFDT